jgi:FHA domain-containing protein
MNIIDKARRLEAHLARGMTGAAKSIVRRGDAREPIELVHAIVDTVEREIQSGGRGTRLFPFNTLDVLLVAPSDHARARLETIVSGDPSLRDRIVDRLRAAHCSTEDLAVTVAYVPRAQKHWTDPQFAIAFSRIAREAPNVQASEPQPPRLEVTVVHGAAEHRTYAFASDRIDLGRGGEVRDTRNGLIRTNHVAFSDAPAPVNRTISRQHAHIAYDSTAGQFRLHDDGSVHGTRIVRKGKTLPVPFGARGVRLQSGDDVVLGEARLRVRFER